MKPEWKKFVGEQKPAEKPRPRPAKRFQVLPGGHKKPEGLLKKESERYGGSFAEQRARKTMEGRFDRFGVGKKIYEEKLLGKRSRGHHTAELPPTEKETERVPAEKLLVPAEKLKVPIYKAVPEISEILRQREGEIARIGRSLKRRR